jgi:SAM-dependent methyltransferase
MPTLAANVTQMLGIAADIGGAIPAGAAILDFGCGRGETVAALRGAGYAAQGVDIEAYWEGAESLGRDPALQQHLHLAQLRPYRLPFADASFDLVVSEQVFEHVMDYEAAFRELRRVLRPQGLSIHVFPARWRPIENHVRIPLATVCRGRAWLAFWAWCGIRNEFQQGLGWREVAQLNEDFLHQHTNYPTMPMVRRWGDAAGVQVSFAPEVYFARHPGTVGRLVRCVLRGLPGPVSRLFAHLAGEVTQRCMLVRRST